MNRDLLAACGVCLLGGCVFIPCPGPQTSTGTTGGPMFPACPANSSRDEDDGCVCWTGYATCVPDGGGAFSCVNEKTDALNCGACGNACPTEAQCLDGRCACDSSSGAQACETDGGLACVDTYTDSLNCDRCGNVCPELQRCTLGICTCVPSLTIEACDSDAGLVCVDLAQNPDGCGGPRPCVCDAGTDGVCCGLSCFDASRDPFNCGACGNVCDSGVCLPDDAGKGVCE